MRNCLESKNLVQIVRKLPALWPLHSSALQSLSAQAPFNGPTMRFQILLPFYMVTTLASTSD